MTAQAVSPREHDEAEEALYFELAKAEHQLAIDLEKVHAEAGDRRDYRRRHRPWGLGDEDALQQTTPLARARYEKAQAEAHRIGQEIAGMEAIYRQHGWTRYYPCNNRDGHIHASLRGCSTVGATTDMGWRPELSGKTVEEAVAKLGETLCSVCFPGAPAEWCRSKSELTRDERAAARAIKQEARYVTQLRDTERFRGYDGSWVTTVAGCQKALRDEVELGDYCGRGPHSWHPGSVAAAAAATRVLLARGVTQAEIDTIIANAVARNKRAARSRDRQPGRASRSR